MGKLRHRATRREHVLTSQHLVGRGPRCALQLASPMASGHHAELRWTGTAWELRDLDSRNGTFLDSAALARGQRNKLALGSLLAFGDPEDLYELIDDGAPGASAISNSGVRQYSQSGTLLLPNADEPECFVWQEVGSWYVEGPDGTVEPATHGHKLTIDGTVWELDLPVELKPTLQMGALLLSTALLRFKVSRNEEHVELEVSSGGRMVTLTPRIYWYTMLTLARARLRDRDDTDVSEAEEGWLYVQELVEQQLQIEATL
ncbi:MAG: FHA domain-containing protein, partial [Myxococcota bacterium]